MSLKKFSFKVLSKEQYARTGIINTSRGKIHTPAFMPVGTQATVKAVFIDNIIQTGSEIILANTYHLMLRPGVERIKKHNGLHKFMNCKLPILTDSGGFQVMSLSKLNKIDREKGAIFNSHIDGKKFILSPEESIRIQKGLNSDIVMVMDECPKNTKDKNKIKGSLDLSMYWAKRSKDAFGINKLKALFGIVQGGLFNDLRIESLEKLLDINFDGYALGGLAVGETQNEMFNVLDGIKHQGCTVQRASALWSQSTSRLWTEESVIEIKIDVTVIEKRFKTHPAVKGVNLVKISASPSACGQLSRLGRYPRGFALFVRV